MSLKIVVRTRIPDTNSSSGVFVAYSSPPPQEMEVFPSLHYGSYMILVPNELPRTNKWTFRLVTLRGRAQWLLGFLIDEMPLPRQLVGNITSEEKATEMRAVLEQYLAGYMDSEIEKFIAAAELGEHEYGQRFLKKRELLKQYINLLENPRENGLPEGIPHPARVVIRISEEHTDDGYFPAGSGWPKVKAPPGWVIGSFSSGDDEGYIELESGEIVPNGKVFKEGLRKTGYLESIWHRILSVPLPAESFVAEMLRGYLVPEYLPDGLLNPHPFLSLADLVDETTRLFCVSAGDKTFGAIRGSLQKFAKETPMNGVLRSATVFYPSRWLLGKGEIDEEKIELVKRKTTQFLYDFASSCGAQVAISPDVTVRVSYDRRFYLSFLFSIPFFKPIFR